MLIKSNLVNVLIQDDKGNLFRIFKIAHEKDKYGENYFKLMLPDLVGQQISTIKTDKYVKPPDIQAFVQIGHSTNLEEFHEFTYHYERGVAHLKNVRGERLHQYKNLPTLHHNLLNFARIVLHDLNRFRRYTKAITGNDLVLKMPLNGLGRLFNLYLVDNINIRIENDDAERVVLLGSYQLNVTGANKLLLIQEFCYFNEDKMDKNTSFSMFIFKDTSVKLEESKKQ